MITKISYKIVNSIVIIRSILHKMRNGNVPFLN